MKAAESKQAAPVKSNVTAKLPKLEISKFTRTILDFNRFYNMFEAQVDKSDSAPVTKEFVDSKVRSLIGGLPFNSEGYEKAKQILRTKYGSRASWPTHTCNRAVNPRNFQIWRTDRKGSS